MASAEGITVSVERAVIDTLRATAQNIFDTHGIRLDNASFAWLDISSVEGQKCTVTGVAVDLSASV